MSEYKKLDILKNAKKVCIITHLEPDLDALASAIVMARFVNKHFSIKVDIFTDFLDLPENYNYFLKEVDINPQSSNYETAIMLDAPNSSRLGRYQHLFDGAKQKFVIDHHATNNFSGDINIVEFVSSTCEIVYKILNYYNFSLNKQLCELIYAGIVTDTNNFTVGNFTERTFEIVSEIAGRFNVKQINQICFTNSLKSMQALAKAIENIEIFENNTIIFSKITKNEAKTMEIQQKDYEGIINRLSTISKSKLVCFVYPKNNEYYVSMRAIEPYNVADIALKHDGGGHKGAAAFNSSLKIEDIKELVLAEFISILKQN